MIAKTAVVCHDAGGAEIVSSWMLRHPAHYLVVVEGPARAVFKKKIKEQNFQTLEDAIFQSDIVLCGTSWQSNLERRAIALGRSLNKKVITFLDHWVNYKERFVENNKMMLPDEIWVFDATAQSIASTLFPEVTIVLSENPYFQDIKSELDKVNNSAPERASSILYVCEPVRDHALVKYGDERYLGYTEEEALLYFLNNIDSLKEDISRILIRPHPSENADKYQWVKQAASSFEVVVGENKSLLEQMAEVSIVVGCESMAMVIGLIAGKRVISTIPPGGRNCCLPHSEIEHMRELISTKVFYG